MMELLMARAQAYCQLYESLTRNPNPTDDTRRAIGYIEGYIEALVSDISKQEKLPHRQNSNTATTSDDDIPF